jgi:hypothetical protein
MPHQSWQVGLASQTQVQRQEIGVHQATHVEVQMRDIDARLQGLSDLRQ